MESLDYWCTMYLCTVIYGVYIVRYGLWLSGLTIEGNELLLPMVVSLVCGLVALALLLAFSSPDKPPKWHKALCVAGFVVAIGWISTIADEVVGILRAFGAIVGVSEAILGVTVFAMVTPTFTSNDREIPFPISLPMSRWREWGFL